MVVYLLELLPFLYCFWRLYRYRTKLQTAQRPEDIGAGHKEAQRMLRENVGVEESVERRAS